MLRRERTSSTCPENLRLVTEFSSWNIHPAYLRPVHITPSSPVLSLALLFPGRLLSFFSSVSSTVLFASRISRTNLADPLSADLRAIISLGVSDLHVFKRVYMRWSILLYFYNVALYNEDLWMEWSKLLSNLCNCRGWSGYYRRMREIMIYVCSVCKFIEISYLSQLNCFHLSLFEFVLCLAITYIIINLRILDVTLSDVNEFPVILKNIVYSKWNFQCLGFRVLINCQDDRRLIANKKHYIVNLLEEWHTSEIVNFKISTNLKSKIRNWKIFNKNINDMLWKYFLFNRNNITIQGVKCSPISNERVIQIHKQYLIGNLQYPMTISYIMKKENYFIVKCLYY